MSGLADNVTRLRESFGKMPSGLKVLLITGLCLALVGGIYTWAADYAKQSRYEALFSRLDARDASEIAQKLTQRKIPYKISSDGTTILVPSTEVHATRLSLAGEGLPRGGVVGFELMDKLSFGATDFDRRVNYLRALTGELTRTIREIDGVEDARVHIVIPENSYFVTRTKPATAAVFLKLRPMFELQRVQIKGIVNLVSRSVEGLKPEDVAVVDLYGRLLSGDAFGGAEERVSSANIELQQGFQKELERSLQTVLERVLGPGNVIAKVSAELNFDQKTVDRVLFQPTADGILRSMQELEETFRGQGSAPSGPAGVTSNVPQYQSGGGGQSDWMKRETTKNFEISEVKERTVVAPGSVRRLSVAVVVNKEMDDQAKTAIQRTVQAAIGADPERRDVVSVSTMAFDNTILSDIKKQMEQPKTQASPFSLSNPLVLGAGAGAIALLIILVLIVATRKRSQRPQELFAKGRTRADMAQALQAAAEQAAAEPEPPKTDPDAERRRRLREDIENVARANPETVAQMIRTWMAEDRR